MTAQDDEEERAWATRMARAFLAPPVVARESAAPDEGPRTAVVALVAVVPLAVPVPVDEARGDEAMRRRGDGEPEEGAD